MAKISPKKYFLPLLVLTFTLLALIAITLSVQNKQLYFSKASGDVCHRINGDCYHNTWTCQVRFGQADCGSGMICGRNCQQQTSTPTPTPNYPSCGVAPDAPVGKKRCVVVGEKSRGGTRCVNKKNGKNILMDCCLNNDKPQWTHHSKKCCASDRVIWRYNPNLPNERGTGIFCESYCLDIDSNIPNANDPVFGVCVKNGSN